MSRLHVNRTRSTSDFYVPPGNSSHDETHVKHTRMSMASDMSRFRSTSTMTFGVARPFSNSVAVEQELNQTFPLSLAYLPAALLATVLEDTLIKLRILAEADTQIQLNTIAQDMDDYRATKFGVPHPPTKKELSGVDYNNVHCEEFKLYKLDKDRAFFTEVMSATYADLALRTHFKSFKRRIVAMEDLNNYLELLHEEQTRNKIVIKELRRQLRQQRVQNKSMKYDAMVILDTLVKKIEDAEMTTEIASRHVSHWERARREQNLEKIRQAEERYDGSVSLFKDKTEQEQRVHAEIETYVTIATRDTMDQVEHCMAKYERDMEQIDLKLQIKRNHYLSMLEKRVAMEDQMAERDRQMEAWTQFKASRAAEVERRRRMAESAVVVQAWWRGLMVRHQLGPHRLGRKRKTRYTYGKKTKK